MCNADDEKEKNTRKQIKDYLEHFIQSLANMFVFVFFFFGINYEDKTAKYSQNLGSYSAGEVLYVWPGLRSKYACLISGNLTSVLCERLLLQLATTRISSGPHLM